MKRSQLSVILFLLVFATQIVSGQPAMPPNNHVPQLPNARVIAHFPSINFKDAAAHEVARPQPTEIEEIEAPQLPPPMNKGVPIHTNATGRVKALSTPSFGTGISPPPVKTFKAEFLSSTSIPPDTMGAVGTTHVVTVTNDRMRIQTRDGIEVSRMTLTTFWAGVTIKGAAISAFDPKVFFDRFNNRFILVSSGNGTSINSGAMFAVSATADPTGTWYRWSVAADPASTGVPGGSGNWIDYPTVGHNKNWIVVNENVFKYTCNTTTCSSSGYWGQQIYVLDKQAAYNNTLGSSINLFAGDFTNTCLPSATQETELACGFTMAPAITEDNTTNTEYMVEDWDSTAGQLRLSKITGTPSAPLLTVGTQFPQSTESWRFDAARIGTANNCGGTCSGGYAPQRQQSANLPSSQRVMTNDSRVQNAVLRGGTLWCAHTVMLAAASQAAGTTIGGAGNPVDNHSGIQWWAIDPTNESGTSAAPIQRGRIHDATANNCHNGQGGTSAVAPCNGGTSAQFGEFFAYPNISVNQNNDVFIGFTRFSPLTYANSAYVIRRSGDTVNTTRDPVVFRPGQANYNIGGGSGTARQNRWGDYSSAQTDPLNDSDFWTVQEYAGTVRDFGIGLAGNWETWWTQVSPAATAPTSGTLIISEFRLRGPQGARDEFVELYNPATTPVIVSTTDGSDGWALANSTTGLTVANVFAVVPNGTVIPAHGHFLVADNPDGANGPTVVYGLSGAACTEVRGADSDTGWSLDLTDNGGIAIFNTSTTANFSNTTRLDSAGFSGVAAGLFKEGNGIPAITATTPTGQMTFYRDLTSGTPKDTGANENDFIFANSVVGETLGSTPRLGAAGPENLSSPIYGSGASTLPAALLDLGVGLGAAPNRLRDNTVVTNGAFGTLSFRRTFTNNTGAPLPRLRFRVIDMTTSPAAGANSDLRVLTAGSAVVSVSGGGTANVGGTTLETPPTQSAGGGLNGSLSVPAVTIATPLAGGATTNLQFTVGVQVTGIYNFCLVPEGLPATTSSTLCFAGTTENVAPSITPSPIARTGGAGASSSTIATVSDTQDAAGSLTVTAITVPSGISVTGITNTSGTITAMVAASCAAAGGANNVVLQVIDSEGATTNATVVVTVTPTPAPATPTITGPATACAASPSTLTASSAGAVSYQWYQNGNLIGGQTASTTSVSSAGSYTVTATNACGTSAQSAPYVVTDGTPATPTVTPGGPTTFCAGGSVTLTSSSASGNQWYDGVTLLAGQTNQTYIANSNGNYNVVVTASGCPSAPSSNTAVTVTPLPATPTITPGGPTTFCAGGSVTLTSSSGSGNQWYLNGNAIGAATNSTYSATLTGNYTVIVTATGCSSAASAATSVTVNPLPATPTITPGGPTTFCNGNNVTLTSSSGSGNQWFLNGNPIGGATATTYVATASGNYTVNTTDGNSCTSTASAATAVTVNPIPATPVIGTSGPTTFCSGGNVTLTSSSANGNQWSLNGNPIGGATSQQYVASAGGNYTVVVTTSGCSSAASAATTVIVNPIPATPTITPGGPTTFCTGGSVTLTSSSASGNQWYLNGNPIGGATSQTYPANASGSYTVKVTTSGCSSAASAATVVTVNPNPNATITAPASVTTSSTGNVASAANAGVGATYAWTVTGGTLTGGNNTPSITFTAGATPGTLTINLTVTTSAGCSDAKSANVNRVLPVVTVTSVSPNFGTVTGGTIVTVNGTNFASGATVTFGGTAATNVVVVSAIKITAKTPVHAAGAVNVTVTNTDTSTGTLTNGYTYNAQVFDPNNDGTIDPADIFYLINYLFLGGPAPHGPGGVLSGDANGDGVVDPADIFYLINYLFLGGQKPNRPGVDSISNPSALSVGNAAQDVAGSITLGTPVLRGGHYFVPVVMTSRGSVAAQTMSLKLHVGGAAISDITVRRAGAAKDVPAIFETSQRSGMDVSYVVAYDPRGLTFDASRSAVVAEVEIAGAGAELSLTIDPALTMLGNQAGTVKATVANGKLEVKGTSAAGDSSPRPPTPGHKVN
jgi:hypothetical protein